MSRTRSIALLLFLSVFFAIPSATADYTYEGWQKGPWEFHKKKNGISMWLNDQVTTGVDGVRADVVVDLPANHVMPFLMDGEKQAEYSYIREFKVLQNYGDWGYLYQRLKATGIQDRDFTVKLVMIKPKTQNGGPYGWQWVQANEKGPAEKDGVVRASVVAGSYVLTPVGKNNEKTRISYRLWFDPSSWVPNFLINNALRNGVFETVAKLRQEARAAKKRLDAGEEVASAD